MQFTTEDQSIDIIVDANDPENDPLTYTVYSTSQITSSFFGNILTLTPIENYFGESNILIMVNDDEFTAQESFNFTVISMMLSLLK